MELTAAQAASVYLNIEHVEGHVQTVELRPDGEELIVDYLVSGTAAPAMTIRVAPDGTTSRTLTV